MENSKIKVLYIAGFERSGSTLINRVLGQIDSFVACGELRDIWEHGVIEDRYCTCGNKFSKCQFWQDILTETFGVNEDIHASKILKLQKQTRIITFSKHLMIPLIKSNGLEPQEYLNVLDRFYRAIKQKTGCKVIVDSTKASWYGATLSNLKNIDLRVLHITRNPCGVCYSLQKRKDKGEPEAQWYNPVRASFSWNIKNFAIEKLLSVKNKHYLRISLEEFIENPQTALESILQLVGEENTLLSFLKENTVDMGLNHIFTGSPSIRSETGTVKLALDERWKTQMEPTQRRVIESLTSLLSRKYGYLH